MPLPKLTPPAEHEVIKVHRPPPINSGNVPEQRATRLPLDDLIKLSAMGRRDDAIDMSLGFFNGLLYEKLYAECDKALQHIDPLSAERLSSSVMVSMLAITLNAKQNLKYRPIFFELVYKEIKRNKGRWYAKELLEKYR